MTSDGEVDLFKNKMLKEFCNRQKKMFVGATTCYLDWKSAAKRQDKHKNLAIGTYLWIASDPSRIFEIKDK